MSGIQSHSTSDHVAAEVRARLARDGISLTAFSDTLGVPALWVLRRFGPSRTVSINVDDLATVADALGVSAADLLRPAPVAAVGS